MTAPGLARAANMRCALRTAGPRGRSGGGRGKSQPEGARLLHLGEPAAEQQSDSSWSFPVECPTHPSSAHLSATLHKSHHIARQRFAAVKMHTLLPQHDLQTVRASASREGMLLGAYGPHGASVLAGATGPSIASCVWHHAAPSAWQRPWRRGDTSSHGHAGP